MTTILILLNIFLLVYTAFFVIVFLAGILRGKKEFPETAEHTRFAVLIPARNEEKVIGKLLTSLAKMDYPRECCTVCVIADRCTDRTVEIAESFGAKVLRTAAEGNNTHSVKNAPAGTKGHVLEFAFATLSDLNDIDAYVILDADNTVDPEFLSEMNKAFAGGVEAVQARRLGSAPGASWVAGGYEAYYASQNTVFNLPRQRLGSLAAVNGSGWAVRKEIAEMCSFRTITEDHEFTILMALRGKKIAYCSRAVCYDEFVEEFGRSIRQRVRWSFGTVQCVRFYLGELVRTAMKGSFTCLDLALVTLMPFVIAAAILAAPGGILLLAKRSSLLIAGIAAAAQWAAASLTALAAIAVSGAAPGSSPGTAVRTAWKGILLFPLFMITWLPVQILCMFRRNVEWKPMR